MFNLLKRIFSSGPPTQSYTEPPQQWHNAIPACAFFSATNLQIQTPYGDTPITLSEHTCVQWHFAAPAEPITRIQIRLGTYGRRNACHLIVQLGQTQARIALADCRDNQYAELQFNPPLTYPVGQAVLLRVFSPDAQLAENNVAALWCSPPVPQFAAHIAPTPLHFAATEEAQFSILCNAQVPAQQLYQSLRSLLESHPHADKELLLYGAQPPQPWLTGAVQWLDKIEEAQPQAPFILWLTQPALFSEGSLQALHDSLLHDEQAQLVMPKVIDQQGQLCSAGGQVFADGSFYQYPATADATHPEYNQPRRVFCAQPPAVLMRRTAMPTLYTAAAYQTASHALLHLSLAAQQTRYCPTACLIVADWHSQPSETDRQHSQQQWAAILATQPQPFLPMPAKPHLHCPASREPLLSIIIPLFNQVHYTWHCLQNLLLCDTHISREIIIIDNASTDATATLLNGLSGAFKIIRNPENRGFVDACQQGAACARGRYIFLLNNDTQMRPGCLENMVKTLENQADIGIAGAKLLYPDGRLQEAGCQLFADGSATNIGRAGDPYADFAQQDRDVDYCSGAALMIRAALWRQLGGFDVRYAPAYYEDTDLCMQARQAGFRVRYCHAAEVIHYEGVTAGMDVERGYKAYQARNQRLFYEKWQDILSAFDQQRP